jgi:hypothetical protein
MEVECQHPCDEYFSIRNSGDSISEFVVIPAVGALNAAMSAGDGVVTAPIVVVRALGFFYWKLSARMDRLEKEIARLKKIVA